MRLTTGQYHGIKDWKKRWEAESWQSITGNRGCFMQEGNCYVAGAGEHYGLDFVPSENDYVIAADGGLRRLEEAGILPDLIIGDFDTLGYCPSLPNVIRLHPEKDDTDMLAALKEGIRKGFSRFHIYGGTGGRIEHTIANLQLLAFLSETGRQGFLYDRDNVITAVTDAALALPARERGFLSVFSHTDHCDGVNLRGLKYELTDARLESTFPLGVSNEFKGTESLISVKSGTLLIVLPKDIPCQFAAVLQ